MPSGSFTDPEYGSVGMIKSQAARDHLSIPEIGEELFRSRNTIKSEAVSIYRKLGTSSRSQAVARSRALGLLAGLRPVFHPIGGMEHAPARGEMVASAPGGNV